MEYNLIEVREHREEKTVSRVETKGQKKRKNNNIV